MLRPKDMKVGVRLAGLSAVGIVLVTVIGFSAISKLSAVESNAANLYKHELLATDAIGRLHDAEGDSRVDVHMYMEAATPKDRADVRADVQDVDGNIDQAVKDFLAADADPSRHALMAQFQSGFASWQRVRDNSVFPAVDRGDVAGAQEIVNGPIAALDEKFAEPVDKLVDLEEKAAHARATAAHSTFTGARTMILLTLFIGIAVAIALSVLITKSITGPLRKTVAVLGDVANRKLSGGLDVSSKDEIGQMAASLNTAMSSLRETLATIDDNVQTLAGASEELSAVSNQMAGSAEETSTQSGAASAAGEQVSASVGTVAAAVEEFSASITEISKNATDAAQVARDAAEMAQIVNDNIGRLDQSSAEIGNVVGVITSIAEQTNLLALNATIEAARAGDAGKGFAVVANEVKELASSTTRATEDISTRITAIQADTHQAIASVGEIMGIIERINSLQSAIAAAVEEQSVTTNEIGRNITEAATGTSEIARNISVVANAAQEAAQGASQTQTSAGELATMSETLRELVGQFEL